MLKETAKQNKQRWEDEKEDRERRRVWRERWVNTRGGRTKSDILYDIEGPYILLSVAANHQGIEYEKDYIPSTETIIKELS